VHGGPALTCSLPSVAPLERPVSADPGDLPCGH